MRLAVAFVAILQSQFKSVKSRQFIIELRLASVFGMSLILPLLCDIESFPIS